MLIAALFTIPRTWKQHRSPSSDEWIQKLWYIYTTEYYSAIKKNTFKLVLMKWMNLEPIILREFRSVAQSFLTLHDTMACSTPGFPVHHQLLELAQTLSIESVMPSNHLILRSPPLLLPSIFPSIWVFSNASILHIRWPKYWSFSFSFSILPMNIQDWFPLGLTDWISLQSKGLSRVFANTTVQKHQFFGTQFSL